MALWDENQSSLVEQRELHRLLLMAKDYGIREESIAVPVGKIDEFLDHAYYEKDGMSSSDIATFLYKVKPNWSNKGIALLIETTEESNKKNNTSLMKSDLRERFGEICLFRFLVYNALLMGEIISSYRMSEITTKLSTFDQSRFILANELSQVPCLFIREVDTQEKIRDTNDCIPLLDSALFNRIKHNKPTIISLTVLSEKFVSPGTFGKCFSSIIQNTDRNKVLKIRLK